MEGVSEKRIFEGWVPKKLLKKIKGGGMFLEPVQKKGWELGEGEGGGLEWGGREVGPMRGLELMM